MTKILVDNLLSNYKKNIISIVLAYNLMFNYKKTIKYIAR